MKHLLTIAGSDPSGGAGIQADLKTFSALKTYGMTVITALTAQNTIGVRAVLPIPASFVRSQIEAINDDIRIDAIKIGMLHNIEIIEAIYDLLSNKITCNNIVLDPVFISKSGHFLLEKQAISAIKKLFPLVTLVTPNADEASELCGFKVDSYEKIKQAAGVILKMGAKNVLIKGGHIEGEYAKDFFCYNEQEFWICSDKIVTNNTHGTGCTLSSAIAVYLAKGYELKKAIEMAKDYLYKAIIAAKDMEIGKGVGPVNHLY